MSTSFQALDFDGTAGVPAPRRTVVVIEDNPGLRRAITALIDGDPTLTVVGSAGGASAGVEMIRSLHPDACVCDVRMPDGNGILVASEARRLAPETRVIALSAYEDGETVVEMLRAGAISYITKSGEREELLDGIHRALNGQSSIPSKATGAVAAELRRLGANVPVDRRPMLRKVLDEHLMQIVLQPVVSLLDEQPIAFEALARINAEPRTGPDVWFEQAASTSLEVEFELAAVRLGLEHLDHLPGGCALHVNISPSVALSPLTFALLRRYDLSRVVLELTEHARLDNYEPLRRALAPLRADGLRIAVDDVGAGFASMRHVISLEPDILKIDISLVHHIHLDRMRHAMVRSLADFGRTIGAVVIGEAVEVEEERLALIALGVPAGQGYLFGRPKSCACRAEAKARSHDNLLKLA